MKRVLVFTDRKGRRWVCGKTLKFLFGIVECGCPHFWDYDYLCHKHFGGFYHAH